MAAFVELVVMDEFGIRPLCPTPRSWTERAYSNLIHYNKLDKGGHFAAWEQPHLFSEEVRSGFRPLRNAKTTALNR